MKLTDKRFWMLVIVIASAAVASAQAVFSVEEISYVEYADAVRRTRCRSTDCETSGTKDRIFPFSLPKIALSDPPGPVFLYPQR